MFLRKYKTLYEYDYGLLFIIVDKIRNKNRNIKIIIFSRCTVFFCCCYYNKTSQSLTSH